MKIINEIKKNYLRSLFISSFNEPWSIWSSKIRNNLGDDYSCEDIFNIIEDLDDTLFPDTRETELRRGQKELSVIGNAFKTLNIWFLNLLFWDTPVIVMKQSKQYTPKVIRDCITVDISKMHISSDKNILIFNIPNYKLLKNIDNLNDHIKEYISNVELVMIQSKTNWSDTVKEAMLWDIIYSADGLPDHVNVGINNLSPKNLYSFKYGFSTWPTGGGNQIEPNSMPVRRVENLSGGNFWLKKTKQDVASNIKELPNRHFSRYYPKGVLSHIKKTHEKDKNLLSSFLDFNW